MLGMVLVKPLLPPTSLAMPQPEGVSESRKTVLPSPEKPDSSILNHSAPLPSQEEKSPEHLYL